MLTAGVGAGGGGRREDSVVGALVSAGAGAGAGAGSVVGSGAGVLGTAGRVLPPDAGGGGGNGGSERSSAALVLRLPKKLNATAERVSIRFEIGRIVSSPKKSV